MEQRAAPESELPNWAIVHADAALRCGLKVTQIESDLVAKGLTPTTAAAVVDRCLCNKCQPPARTGMLTLVSRIASLLVAAGYITLVSFSGDGRAIAWSVCHLLLPMACIWFAKPFGDYVGPAFSSGLGHVNRPTPAGFIALGGWILLVGVPVVILAVTKL
jgi:hypothetical protein